MGGGKEVDMYNPKDEQILILVRDGNPSISELATHLNLRAVSSVKERLDGLRERGLITWEDGKHRTLELTKEGKRYLDVNYGKDVFRNEPSVSGQF
jgi:predicted transcriptional regulator